MKAAEISIRPTANRNRAIAADTRATRINTQEIAAYTRATRTDTQEIGIYSQEIAVYTRATRTDTQEIGIYSQEIAPYSRAIATDNPAIATRTQEIAPDTQEMTIYTQETAIHRPRNPRHNRANACQRRNSEGNHKEINALRIYPARATFRVCAFSAFARSSAYRPSTCLRTTSLANCIPQREAPAAAIAFRVPTAPHRRSSGPKAHQQASPGQARHERRPGAIGKMPSQAPTGRDNLQSRSIPNVSFIHLDAMLATQRSEFILKRQFPMMLLLRRDISADLLHVGLADGEYAVSALPVKST